MASVRSLHHRRLAGPMAVGLAMMLVAAGCGTSGEPEPRTLGVADYEDKLHGAWQAIMVANESGLELQGVWLDEPGEDGDFELLFPDQWSTDDDTHVEWLDLHIMETHGIEPTYRQIRDEWVDHLNNDIWVATRVARDLMDDDVLPPDTGSAELNPDGVWSMDAQLETELFGLIAPGLPDEARRRARFFARVSNSGLAVDVSAFYAHLYSEAFFESDIDWLLDRAVAGEPEGSEVSDIVANVRQWHAENPGDWRATRVLVADAYDTDPEWWASKVNFAVTIMALLYGEGDMNETIEIAALAGWDADNNMTTSAGLLGVIQGFDGLPGPMRVATEIYFNEDLTGDLPMFDTVENIAARTLRIGESAMFAAGGQKVDESYRLPVGS